jgi:hypothetical protein
MVAGLPALPAATLTPQEIFLVFISVRGWVDPRAIISINNYNDTIGNRTRDLPACSAVPQPTAPPPPPPPPHPSCIISFHRELSCEKLHINFRWPPPDHIGWPPVTCHVDRYTWRPWAQVWSRDMLCWSCTAMYLPPFGNSAVHSLNNSWVKVGSMLREDRTAYAHLRQSTTPKVRSEAFTRRNVLNLHRPSTVGSTDGTNSNDFINISYLQI